MCRKSTELMKSQRASKDEVMSFSLHCMNNLGTLKKINLCNHPFFITFKEMETETSLIKYGPETDTVAKNFHRAQ